MKRLAMLALLLFALLSIESTTVAGGKNLLAGLLDRVEPRRGIVNRSAVLIPLVLREGLPINGSGPAQPEEEGKNNAWVPVNEDLVKLVIEKKRPRFLPAGTLLSGLGRERLLSRGVMLVPGAELIVRATRCDIREDDAPEEGEGKGAFGAVAPHAQRKVDLLVKDREALETLLLVQMAIAGPEAGAKTVSGMMAAKGIEGEVNSAAAGFRGLPRMYGGAVAGHVLFIGLRPVEFVLFREPADYARYGPAYLRAAAVSLALWETYYGVDPLLVQKVDDRLLIPEVEKIVAAHRAARVRRAHLASKEKGGGDLYRISVANSDPVMKFEGRLLIEGEKSHLKQPFQLESYQDGKRVVLPTPLAEPGGRPTDAKPDVSHGAMTLGFLIRLAGRMASRR